MLIINTIGGLGNQMFQVAMAYALSKHLRTSSKLDISGFNNYRLHQGFDLERIFGINIPIATEQEIKKVMGWRHSTLIRKVLRRYCKGCISSRYVVELSHAFWPNLFSVGDQAYLEGYWQSDKYFADLADDVHGLFQFKPKLSEMNKQLVLRITSLDAVSIHIRRGDYLTNKLNQSIYYECSADYYSRAIGYISSRVKEPRFFVFSDDISWCKTLFASRNDVEYISHNHGKDSYVDMQLMSLCKHNIIANSTFSWWGAWLNNNPKKIVISPKEWFVDGRSSDDLIPEQWVRL